MHVKMIRNGSHRMLSRQQGQWLYLAHVVSVSRVTLNALASAGSADTSIHEFANRGSQIPLNGH